MSAQGDARPEVITCESAPGRMTKTLILTIKGYQRLISPFLPPSCRFTPSCSSYAIQALEKHRLFKGTWLTVKRVAKCHPFNHGGCDPVP